MKKSLFAIFTAALLTLSSFSGMAIIANASEDNDEGLTVGAEEDFGNLNIFEMTEETDSADWAFTMLYDRLLYLDSNGRFYPELAESYEINIEETDLDFELPFDQGFEFPEWPSRDKYSETDSGWHEGIPGWRSYPDGMDPSEFGYAGYLGGTFKMVSVTMDFVLRENIEFSSGQPFNSEAMVQLIEYAQLPENKDSIAGKQWECIKEIVVDSNQRFTLHFNFPESYGFVDFLYGLAAPKGSIVDVITILEQDANDSTDPPAGTGAFTCTELIPHDSATFARNEGWWGYISAPVMPDYGAPTEGELADVITIKYCKETESVARDAWMTSKVDVGITSGEWYETRYGKAEPNDIEGENWLPPPDNVYALPDNPVVLAMPPLRPNPYDPEIATYYEWLRKIIAFGFAKRSSKNNITVGIRDRFPLLSSSNDFWALDAHDLNPNYCTNVNREECGLDAPPKVALTLLSPRKYHDYAAFLNESLNKIDVTLEIYEVEDDEMEDALKNKEYDIALYDFDLLKVNSAYHTLNGWASGNMDILLRLANSSTTLLGYAWTHAMVQMQCYQEASLLNLGWEQKNVILNGGVGGFTLPGGFCPTGDMNRLDFRWLRWIQKEGV